MNGRVSHFASAKRTVLLNLEALDLEVTFYYVLKENCFGDVVFCQWALLWIFTTPMYIHYIYTPPSAGEQFFSQDANLVAMTVSWARVMMSVDRPGRYAVSFTRHWDVPVTGYSDAISRVEGIIVYGL